MTQARTYIIYATMIGLPVLMLSELGLKLLALNVFANFIMLVIALGLIIFGIAGIAQVYDYQLHFRPTQTKIYGKKIGHSSAPANNNVELIVTRFNPAKNIFEDQRYKIAADKHTTVLSALIDIKSMQDNGLSLRYSCRMGVCGSCAMVINGKPSLACETMALQASKHFQISVAPMEAHKILKDLATDMTMFFENHKQIEPYLFRKDNGQKFTSKNQLMQTQQQRDEYLPYSECIMCGLCLDACPIVNTNPDFIGPQALSQVYRYYKDSRDQKRDKRLDYIDTLNNAWGCEFSGSCSKVCPKGVDPASAIQMLKGDIIKKNLKDSIQR